VTITQDQTVTRYHQADFDVNRSKRLIEGVAVPYGVAEEVSDDFGWSTYLEEWDRGVFAKYASDPAMTGRVQFNFMHDASPASWVGKATRLVETDEGLVGQWRVDPSPMGDVVLFKVADGQLPGLSIQATPIRSATVGGVTHRELAKLWHVAAVDEPAFTDAVVTALRSRRPTLGHARRDAAAAIADRFRRQRG
jgi:caudovirus prohead protease